MRIKRSPSLAGHQDLAYRYRFYPTPVQAVMLAQVFGCLRVVWNTCLRLREQDWVLYRKNLNYDGMNDVLTMMRHDKERPWLQEVSIVPLQQALRHLDRAYVNFFEKRAKYPKAKKKHNRQSAEFTASGFRYKNGQLFLAKMKQPLDVIWSRPLPGIPSTITIIKEPDGAYYVSCRVQVAQHRLPLARDAQGQLKEVGIDLNLGHSVVLSTGEKITNPRFFTNAQKRLKHLQKALSRAKLGSKRREKKRLMVAKAHAKMKHARRDFIHKMTTTLVCENQVICVEDLAIHGMLKAKLFSKSIADVSWGEILRQLEYKCRLYGRELIKIDRFEPTTKVCSCCQKKGPSLSLHVRRWTCDGCKTEHDRDVNAAINVLHAGLRPRQAAGQAARRETVSPKVVFSS